MAVTDWLKKGVMWYAAVLLLGAALVSFTVGRTQYAVGLLLVGLVAYWWVDERGETMSATETAERVGDRASGLFGGLVSWFTALTTTLLMIALTLSGQLLDMFDLLVQLATTAPVPAGLLGIGGILGYFDWMGRIELTTQEWVVVAVALVVGGVLARRALYGRVNT